MACAVALVRDGRLVIQTYERTIDGGAVRDGIPVAAQVAAELAMFAIQEMDEPTVQTATA